MKARVGDRVIVGRHRPGDVERQGEILEVRGEASAPRYLVRWSDGHESIFVPGSETTIERRRTGGRKG